MLAYIPHKRISAKEALDNPWINSNSKKEPLDNKIFINLESFNVKSKLYFTLLSLKINSKQQYKFLLLLIY